MSGDQQNFGAYGQLLARVAQASDEQRARESTRRSAEAAAERVRRDEETRREEAEKAERQARLIEAVRPFAPEFIDGLAFLDRASEQHWKDRLDEAKKIGFGLFLREKTNLSIYPLHRNDKVSTEPKILSDIEQYGSPRFMISIYPISSSIYSPSMYLVGPKGLFFVRYGFRSNEIKERRAVTDIHQELQSIFRQAYERGLVGKNATSEVSPTPPPPTGGQKGVLGFIAGLFGPR